MHALPDVIGNDSVDGISSELVIMDDRVGGTGTNVELLLIGMLSVSLK